MTIKGAVGLVVAAAAASLACGAPPQDFVIPGPAAPSRVTTARPLVWDSREELADWTMNAVTRGSVTLEGEGRDAFVRVVLGFNGAVLRGPDLAPPVPGVRGARVRVRLRHDRPRAPGSVQTERFELRYEVESPAKMLEQPSMYVNVEPSDDWRELSLRPGLFCCLSPLTVRYGYVSFGSTSPATMEIDWIELTQGP